jgi:hypothetical protein
MSAFQYYKTLGQQQSSPKYKLITTTGNAVVWTPTTSTRIAVTNLTVSCLNTLGGTISFFFGGANNAQKLAEFGMAATTVFSPNISGWESTAQDAPLYVNVAAAGTNTWTVTAEGFELDL